MKFLIVLCLALVISIEAAQVNKGKLKFKVSGRRFSDHDPGFGTTDPYFELYVSTDGGKSKTKLTRSDTISDNENPDWGQTFEFDFDRSRDQWWWFAVYDEDRLRKDDTVGRAWISVADYVSKGQIAYARLDKDDGYLIIQSVEKQQPYDHVTPIGQLPMPGFTPGNQTLRFRLSAQNLPTKDDVGFIDQSGDPYAIIYLTEGINGKRTKIGQTNTMSRTTSPSWGETFQLNWVRSKDQWLLVLMYDEDNFREDDKLGVAWIQLNDYVAKGQSWTVPLPKSGTLTISRA